MKVPKGRKKPLSPEILAEGLYRAHGNAIRLAEQAELLVDHGFYPACISTGLLAVEEFGKAHMLLSAAYFRSDEDARWQWLWRHFEDHREKVRIMEYTLHWPSHRDKDLFHKRVNELRQLREEGLYVQFDAASDAFLSPDETLEQRGGAEKLARRHLAYLHGLIQIIFFLGRPSLDELRIMLRQYRDRAEAGDRMLPDYPPATDPSRRAGA